MMKKSLNCLNCATFRKLSDYNNEQPILLSGCESVICPIDQFRLLMNQKTQCNFTDYCKMDMI